MASKFYLEKLSKKAKAEQGRPWIYTDEIKEYDGEYKNGDIVEVYNHKHYFIGKGYINDASKIAIRIMTRDINEEIDKEFFRKRFKAAWEYRETVIDTSSCRFIFGEADFLPGLTIDKFEDYYVIQISTLGMDQFRDIVVQVLVEDFNAKGVYERSDLRTREIEGLDCFTHTGSFALNAGIASAKSVLGIDVSQHAIDCATKNSELNTLQDTVKFECHNAFDVLADWSREGRKFDVVILDPPAFTKSRGTVKGATRGYKEINLRGIKMVKEGGFFVTCSCSHYMAEDLLRKTIADAAHDAHRSLRQIEFRTQSCDHPILWNSDESYYLKFFVFQVV